MNKVNMINRIIFAVLTVLCVGMLSRNTAYAADGFKIQDCSYNWDSDEAQLVCSVRVTNQYVTALAFQVLDSEGNTVLFKTRSVEDGWSEAVWNDIDFKVDEYTMVVSDFSGKYGSAEAQFYVEAAVDWYMGLRISDSITAVFDLYIPEDFERVVVDGQEFNLNHMVDYCENGVVFRKEGNNGYHYTYMKDIPAKELDYKIDFFFYEEFETELLNSVMKPMISCSVRDYLKTRMANEDNDDYEVCKALDAYGYAAQTYFDYNAPEEPVVIGNVGDLSAYKCSAEGACTDFAYIGSSLILDGTVTIRHYFIGNPRGIEASISVAESADSKVNIVDCGSFCYVEIRNIAAFLLDMPFDLKVRAGDDTCFMLKNYSALTYCEEVISNHAANTNLVTVAKAIVQYNRECAAYKEKHNS